MEKNKHIKVGAVLDNGGGIIVKVTSIGENSFAGTILDNRSMISMSRFSNNWTLDHWWKPVHGYNTPLWKVLNGEEE